VSFRADILLKETREIKEGISKVWGAIDELTRRVKELVETRRRTEHEIEKIWGVIKELAEAQKRTEERLESFKKTTEENFNKVWNAIRELTEAQKRTEERLNNLIEEHRKTREKLEGLSDSFGYFLEDRAIKSLPKILKENYDIEVVGNLKRDYFIINREHIEVNIFGKVKKGDEEYTLLGEAKSRVSKKEIDKFIRKCKKISKEAIKILISYVFSLK
jgi:chromosome segregation ATPase